MNIKIKQSGVSRYILLLTLLLFCLIGSISKANAFTEKNFPEADLEALPAKIAIREPEITETLIRPEYSWWSTETNDCQVLVSHAAVGTVVNEWLVYGEYSIFSTYSYWRGPTHLRTGNHTWWVRARNAEGSGPWSDPVTFKIWNTESPTGSVNKTGPVDESIHTTTNIFFTWTENSNASWYKVFMTDISGKLYNQYHKAAEICYDVYCYLYPADYEPLFFEPRGLSELPEDTWIHWNVMPVNVAGNGDWTGYTKFWISSQ